MCLSVWVLLYSARLNLVYNFDMGVQSLIDGFIGFLNGAVLPGLLALAFVVFLWNTARYFIIEGDNTESHEKAKSTAAWGIAAFVVIGGFWGIVNLFIGDLGLDNKEIITPDYMSSRDAELGGAVLGGTGNGSNSTADTGSDNYEDTMTYTDTNQGSGDVTSDDGSGAVTYVDRVSDAAEHTLEEINEFIDDTLLKLNGI